jgi:hypothetical protein
MIESYRDALLKKCSQSMARVLANLKSILGEAQRRGLVAHNAASPVRVDLKKRESASGMFPQRRKFKRSWPRLRGADARSL